MNNQERAAEVIRRNNANHLYPFITAQALADAGLLMPDLPEPTRIITPTWVKFSDNIDVRDDGVDVYFADNYGEDPEVMSPDEARSAAFNLLAAAKLAEEQE